MDNNNAQKSSELKNLAWFDKFLHTLGISKTEAAKTFGITKQELMRMFRSDDCSLARMQERMELFGYSLNVSFAYKEPPQPKNDSVFQLNIQVSSRQKCRRLTFLKNFMDDLQLSKTDVANKINTPVSTIYSMFSRDDIKFSSLSRIAEAYGVKLSVEIKEHAGTKGTQDPSEN